MSKPNKPGIFDPWRQAAPPPAKTPGQPPRQLPALDDDKVPVERCISFEGKRAGVNVWLDARTENPLEAALWRVKELLLALAAMKKPEVSAVLQAHNISADGDALTSLSAEAVGIALRKILPLSPEAAVLLAKYHVKAFIK